MKRKKKIALIAHDRLKPDLVEWAKVHYKQLKACEICATGTTGARLEDALKLKIQKLKSGPLGGDLQIGAKLVEGEIDLIVFFWDPLSPQPHDVDVKALLRIAVVYDIPLACNSHSASLIFSALMNQKGSLGRRQR